MRLGTALVGAMIALATTRMQAQERTEQRGRGETERTETERRTTKQRAERRRETKRTERRHKRAKARRAARHRRSRHPVTRWHRDVSEADRQSWQSQEPWPLVLHSIHGSITVTLTPASTAGGFDAEDLAAAEEAFAYRDGSHGPIHPRLLDLVYRAVRRFEAPVVHILSGYRPTRASSRHAQGRAVDMVLPGVRDTTLARFFRKQGFVGVGIYPRSHFVHVDVRSRSYFWSDRSGPGQRNRERAILQRETRKMDRAAQQRGELAVEETAGNAAEAETGSETESESLVDVPPEIE